jgi:hypothetical protein
MNPPVLQPWQEPFASKPSLVWMLLYHYHDSVSSYLDPAYDHVVSAPSRKLGCWTSLSGMSGH